MRLWRIRLFFALGVFLVFMWGICLHQRWRSRGQVFQATVSGEKGKNHLLTFTVDKPGLDLVLYIRAYPLRGMGGGDINMDLSILNPSARPILYKEGEVFRAEILKDLNTYKYLKKFPFHAEKKGTYTIRLKVLSDYVSTVSIVVRKEK